MVQSDKTRLLGNTAKPQHHTLSHVSHRSVLCREPSIVIQLSLVLVGVRKSR